MIASPYQLSTVSNQSGVSYDASEGHTNMTTFSASIIDQATSILGYRSRFLPQVSTRAQTLTQLDTLVLGVLGGVSGLRMRDDPNSASAKMYASEGLARIASVQVG